MVRFCTWRTGLTASSQAKCWDHAVWSDPQRPPPNTLGGGLAAAPAIAAEPIARGGLLSGSYWSYCPSEVRRSGAIGELHGAGSAGSIFPVRIPC